MSVHKVTRIKVKAKITTKRGGPMADEVKDALPPEATVVSDTSTLPNLPEKKPAFEKEQLQTIVKRIIHNTRSADPPNVPVVVSDKALQLRNAEKSLGSFDPKLKIALEIMLGEQIPWESNQEIKKYKSFTMLVPVQNRSSHTYTNGEPCLVTDGRTDRALKMNGTMGNHLHFIDGYAKDTRLATNDEIAQFVIKLVQNGHIQLLIDGAQRIHEYDGDVPIDEAHPDDEVRDPEDEDDE
jgi:hypothetical protein